MESNHCQIVRDSLIGEREVDEQTFASLAILNERLGHLKKLDKIFGNVTFSRDVRGLARRKNVVGVC